ncbi:MAG: AAA family ATPase, partial [Ruminococcus sp.]|nr:AAA family ATPase [Ruminococcus sp.]
YRPTEEGGFVLKEGSFYKFCKKAEADSDKDYFFIIDEINRGNLSKIFGELLMLIEADKRGEKVRLAYKEDKDFSVPKNLYIIGMMNTADRSLAMIDYALRRRFAFYEMKPAFGNGKFKAYAEKVKNAAYRSVIDEVVKLNEDIEKDTSLGKGFEIGHSFFCYTENKPEEVDDEWVENVVKYELFPTIEEYWFDDEDKVKKYKGLLNSALTDGKSNGSNVNETGASGSEMTERVNEDAASGGSGEDDGE